MTYRLLNPGELILSTDEFLFMGSAHWQTTVTPGVVLPEKSQHIYRRVLPVPDWWIKHPEIALQEQPICATEAQSIPAGTECRSFTKEQILKLTSKWVWIQKWDGMPKYLEMIGTAYLMADYIWENHDLPNP